MKRDIDYVIKDGQVVIVDEFTGRLMFGRRYSDGLHQAIEAKEACRGRARKQDACDHHVPELLPPVRQALRHDRHGASPRKRNSATIYNLDIVEIPTNRPVIRIDDPDVVYKTEAGKVSAPSSSR